MRDLIVIIVIMALIFGGDTFIKKYLDTSSKDLIIYVEEMSGDFEASYEEKAKRVKELLMNWEKKESPWIIIEYHDAINDIEDAVIEIYSYYLSSDRDEFDIAYRKLMRLIDDLKNRVDLSLENVL